MNMKKLAELANVSVATVSKAFSGSVEISEQKREEIFRLAKENGCYDKYFKKKYSDKIIAVICPEFQSGYYSRQLSYLGREIEKRGGIMLVSTENFDEGRRAYLGEYFAEMLKVDGMIVYGELENGKKYSTPVVSMCENDMYDSVCVSNNFALSDVVKYLLKNGHKRIAFIGEARTAAKLNSFMRAMEVNGIEVKPEYIAESGERFQAAGYEAMKSLLMLEEPPTAVVAAYDEIAIGAMHSIYESGKRIPEDISVIGMDDIRGNSYVNVPLTSITSYDEDLCEIVVDMLFERIENPKKAEPKKVRLSSELVKRKSVQENE